MKIEYVKVYISLIEGCKDMMLYHSTEMQLLYGNSVWKPYHEERMKRYFILRNYLMERLNRETN